MKLKKFNPVQEALQSQRGFQGSAYRRFRKRLCWACQKEVNVEKGVVSATQHGNICAAQKAGAPLKFVCNECLAKVAAKREKEKQEGNALD